MNYRKPSDDTTQIVLRGKDSLARQLREVVATSGKSAEEVAQDIRRAAEFITDQLRVEPKSPIEVIELAAKRSLAAQVADLLKGSETPEEKVAGARAFIERFIIKTEAEILSALQNKDDRSIEILARQEAGEELSAGELAYVKAIQDGHGEYTADLLAWQAAAPNSLQPEEAAFLEAKLMGLSDKAANTVAALTLKMIDRAIRVGEGGLDQRNE